MFIIRMAITLFKSISKGARGVWDFYITGFREMTVGKTLWAVILIKLFIFFVVMKLFFFPNFLSSNFDTDEQRADYVRERLTNQ